VPAPSFAGMPTPPSPRPSRTAVADALDYARDRGMHRDVKPVNVLLTNFEHGTWRILLVDFGITRCLDNTSGLTAMNTTVGTVAYAAPERLMDSDIDGPVRAGCYSVSPADGFATVPAFQPDRRYRPTPHRCSA